MQSMQSDNVYFECYKQQTHHRKHKKPTHKKPIPQYTTSDVPNYTDCLTKDKATDELLLDGSALIRENGYSATNSRSAAGAIDISQIAQHMEPTTDGKYFDSHTYESYAKQCMIENAMKEVQETLQLFNSVSGSTPNNRYEYGTYEPSYGNSMLSERQAYDIIYNDQFYN